VTILALLLLTLVASARAQSAAIEIRVMGEYRASNGDTAESARQLALVDGRQKALRAAAARLLGRADVQGLQLKPIEVEAFTFALLEIEAPSSREPAVTRGPLQLPLRAPLDADETTRRMAGLRADQDATYTLLQTWKQVQQMHLRLADQSQRRAQLTGEAASTIVSEQLQAVKALEAKRLAAHATAALARTEQSAVGGRAPSAEGRDRAARLAEAALAMAPDSPDARYVMGDLLIDAQQPEAAAAQYRKALATDGDSSAGHTKLAEALRLQGKFDEALAELREALRLAPDFSRAHADRGMILRAQSQIPEAIAAYKEAIRFDPDSIEAHNGLAITLANIGQREEAVAEFREIVRVDPDSAIGYYNLAYVLADLDRDVESAAALREVIRINPNHYNARYNLGELFRLEGKFDESAKQFREYLRLAPPDSPRNLRNIERAKGFVEKFEEK
jgi:tetratricopeptide (TPR) repeat protein